MDERQESGGHTLAFDADKDAYGGLTTIDQLICDTI